MSDSIMVSEPVSSLVNTAFILKCVDDAERRPATAHVDQHHYHFKVHGKDQSIVVTIGKTIPTSVMLPAEAAELRKKLLEVHRDERIVRQKNGTAES